MIKHFRDSNGGGFRDRSGPSRFGDRDRGFGGGGRSGGFRDRSSGPRQMFDATCSTCGNECQVPFRPNGSKPVLCNSCFGKNDAPARSFSDSPQRSFNSINSASQSDVSSSSLNQINAKLDKILKVLADLEIVGGDEDEEEPMEEHAHKNNQKNKANVIADEDEEEPMDENLVEDSFDDEDDSTA